MRQREPLNFQRFVLTPENRAACLAVRQIADNLADPGTTAQPVPLFLYGPSGTGKTHLTSALVADVTHRQPRLLVTVLPAGEFGLLVGNNCASATLEAARDSDLFIVEDVQYLGGRDQQEWVGAFVHLFDYLNARGRQMVCTAPTGPAQLPQLPARVVSRLAGGLVVGLEPLGPASRLAVLQDKAQRRQLAVRHEVLAWLADHLGGSVRALEGAIVKLEALSRLSPRLPDVASVAAHFGTEVDALRPTVQRIAERVSGYFRVEPRQLQSRQRYRHVLVPRQIGMYLARHLTDLSLEQIGAYFGGRDHTTVLHACRKVEQALKTDVALSGAVRQLQQDLA